jgi:hypothetical protein
MRTTATVEFHVQRSVYEGPFRAFTFAMSARDAERLIAQLHWRSRRASDPVTGDDQPYGEAHQGDLQRAYSKLTKICQQAGAQHPARRLRDLAAVAISREGYVCWG